MKDFLLLFRQPSYDYSNTSPKEMQALTEKWQNWVGGIAAQGKLAGSGPRLAMEGKVLKAGGVVTDGPFVEAESLEEATTLAHGCPAIDSNGSVEIRPVMN
jgi:hypothetical protein